MPFPSRWTTASLSLVAAGAFFVVPLRGEEPAAEFLRAAQDRGYGEVAVDYLESLAAGHQLPKPLAEMLDLELSRSYRIAVAEAFNPTEAEARLAQAQSHLDKFLKEHPNHPEVARAIESWGEIALDRALTRIRQAAGTKDKGQKEKYLIGARADLIEAKTRLADATARYFNEYTNLKSTTAADASKRGKSTAQLTKKQRNAEEAAREAEFTWLDCRFKAAKVDFYRAQTYLDAASPERKEALANAARSFDDIYQSYRENLAGLHAHMWHGRTADALGDDQLALDIYDEVLATSPDGRERETGLEPLFAQVQYLRLIVIGRAQGPQAVLKEALPWLQQHQTWKKFDGYQGVSLEVAKANLKVAAELNGQKKSTLMQSTLAMLSDISKARGEHQQEAILLRRGFTKGGSHDPATAKTFDEAFAMGEEAAENLDWASAIGDFNRALELKSTVKDASRVASATLRLEQARYQLAAVQYGEGKFDEALAGAEAIVATRPESPLAPAAASLSISAALSIYAKAGDKKAELMRLTKIANDVIARWPDKAEADDARIALGQAELVRGELPAAIGVFEHVNVRSQRYPAALLLAGQTHWRLYLSGKAKGNVKSDEAALIAERNKAEMQLTASLEAQRKDVEPGKPIGRQLFETQLLLAELKLESGASQDATSLVEPLVALIASEKPAVLDNAHLRAFVTAARAQAAAGEPDKAAATANLLVQLGQDDAPVDGVLNSILRLSRDQWQKAEAAAIEARTEDPSRRAVTEAAAAQSKARVSQLIDSILGRQHHSLAAMIYIADTCDRLGKVDAARELYQKILSQAEKDSAFQRTNALALTRIQSQLVGLLRQKGQFAEGLAQVEKLIEQYPNALEPKMEKGRLLQGWAESDPAHFDEAVAHWTMLRTRLAKAVKKPPEYFEVVYNAAACLFAESLKNNNPPKALQAEQLLNATLVLNPNLSGPEMVARYKELLQKVRQLQGRSASTAR